MKVRKEIEKNLEINVSETKSGMIQFIKNKVGKAGAEGAVIGLSGGLDSSTIAYLTVKALGKEKVLAVFMPEKGVTEEKDFEDVEKIVKDLKIDSKTIPVNSILKKIKNKVGASEKEQMSLANMKARIRMLILYYFANKFNYLVVGTSNKSEYKCGYFTKYGDGASDIDPMGSIYKTNVKKIAKEVGVPKRIIKKQPSAGLWKDQTDEKELGLSYEKIDKIYKGLEMGFSETKIAKALGIKKSEVEKFEKMEKNSQHKREGPAILDF